MRGTIATTTIWTILTLLAPTNSAVAQNQGESVQEKAEVLFAQGLRLMKSDHCRDAIPLFSKSNELDPAAATSANLATCYDRIGKIASAYLTYQSASREAILEGNTELQKSTDQAMAALAPTLTRLRVAPLGDVTDRTIRVNGAVVADLREPILLDPGENFIEATAPGRVAWRRTLNATAEGALVVIEVPELRPLQTEPALPLRSNIKYAPTAEQSGATTKVSPWILLGAGVGVTSFAVSAGFALSAVSKHNASSEHCQGSFCTKEGIELREQALSRADVATWAFGLGLASAASIGVLWLTSSHHEPPRKLSISPWLQPKYGSALAGVSLRGEL